MIAWRLRLPCSIIAATGAMIGPIGQNGRRDKVADLKKGARITGTARDKLAADLKKKYEKGASIRSLAESTGRSYGFVHRVLSESGVTLRGRGGATRSKKK
ncbi:helix-turn-helix domain-containing protein [Allokutzneria multivorans]|uniref:Helix-turn-helix domain-containing protein n=1 Tax=Allokutzneria multivorans TaxID=1142134 RepID=A0ABP7U2Y1_9PSEU